MRTFRLPISFLCAVVVACLAAAMPLSPAVAAPPPPLPPPVYQALVDQLLPADTSQPSGPGLAQAVGRDTSTLAPGHWLVDPNRASAAGSAWQRWPYGSPDRVVGKLWNVSMSSATDGWIVGESTGATVTAIALHWNGTAWSRVPLPPGSVMLTAVGAAGPSDAWAFGDAGVLRWNGTAWSKPTALPSAAVVRSVHMLSISSGWAAASNGVIFRWQGTAWEQADSPVDEEDLNSISMVAENDGWIAGSKGTLLHWDGTEWQQAASPVAWDLNAVHMASAGEGWAVGSGGTALHRVGSTWQLVPIAEAGRLTAVYTLGGSDAWASEENGNLYHWDGTRWTRAFTATGQQISGLTFTAWNAGWAIGPNTAVLHWDGVRWGSVDVNAGLPTNDLTALSMASPAEGWAAGTKGTLLHWQGTDWAALAPADAQFLGVSAVSPSLALAVGYQQGATTPTILKWDGTNWQAQNHTLQGTLYAVDLLDASHAWAVGQTDEGAQIAFWDGQQWAKADAPAAASNYLAVDMIDPANGWAVGSSGAVVRWDGSTWAAVTSPVNTLLTDVAMLDANRGWVAGDDGTLLAWDGVSWQQVTGLPVASTLLAITVLAANDVWVAGSDGVMLHWDGSQWALAASATANGLTVLAPAGDGTAWGAGTSGQIIRYAPAYSLAGRVTDASTSRAPLAGVAMSTQSGAVAYTDAAGYFTFTAALAGSYTITPTLTGYTFLPRSQTVSVPPDQAGVSFTGSRSAWLAWPPENPMAVLPDVAGIELVAPDDGWAIGSDGSLYHWDGANWSSGASPTKETLTRLDLLTASDGWAVGAAGTVLHWNGLAWQSVPSNSIDALLSVAALAPNDVWIGTEHGGFLHWDGTALQAVAGPAPYPIYSISALTPGNIWAVGGMISPDGVTSDSVILHWNGTAWQRVYSPAPQMLTSVHMLSANDGWAAGLASTMLHWDGTVWNLVPVPGDALILLGVAMRSANDGWTFGVGEQRAPVVAHWDGQQWDTVAVDLGPNRYFLSMSIGGGQMWAGGTNGLLAQYTGDQWQRRYPLPAVSENVPYWVDMLNPSDGWIAGISDTVFHWNGQEWQPVAVPGSNYSFNFVKAYSATDAWLAGYPGAILHWDGSAWKTTTVPPPPASNTRLLNSLAMLSPTDGWAVGSDHDQELRRLHSLMLHWDGTAWSEVSTPAGDLDLTSVAVFAPNDAWAAGEQATMLHYDGTAWSAVKAISGENTVFQLGGLAADDFWASGTNGLFWHYHRVGGELRWEEVQGPTDGKIQDFVVRPNGELWAIDSNNQAILHFDGLRWQVQESPASGLSLFSLAMPADDSGWVVGNFGLLLRYAPVYRLAGRVVAANGAPVAGAAVRTSLGRVAFTGYDGTYSFDAATAGTHAIIPSSRGLSFDPAERQATLPPDGLSEDFVARPYFGCYLPTIAR